MSVTFPRHVTSRHVTRHRKTSHKMANQAAAQHPLASGVQQQAQRNRNLSRFMFRHWTFKLGAIGVLLATLLIIFGLSGPGWAGQRYLWGEDPQGPQASVTAVKVLYSVAVVGILLSLLLELYQDFICRFPWPPENKAVEITSFSAGLSGVIGTVVFSSVQPGQATREGGNTSHSLGWAFALATTSSTLTIVSAALIVWSRVYHSHLMTSAVADAGGCRTGDHAAEARYHAEPATPMQTFAVTAYPGGYIPGFPGSSASSTAADPAGSFHDGSRAQQTPPFDVMGRHWDPVHSVSSSLTPGMASLPPHAPTELSTPIEPSAPPLEDVLY